MSDIKLVQIDVTTGPSKFDLMNSLFVWQPNHLTVHFQDARGTYYEVMISAVEAEDGSGDRWMFKGREVIGGKVAQKPLTGFFDTKNRHGYLKVEATEIA